MLRGLLIGFVLVVLAPLAAPAQASSPTQIDTGFRLLYDLRFADAREQFAAWQHARPDDPLGYAAEAAAYLFEEFHRQGILTSEFFRDDDRLLGGIDGTPDQKSRDAFFRANTRAHDLARTALIRDPRASHALFVLTLSAGMLADFSALIEKKQSESLRHVREARKHADRLLAVDPDAADAYLALGAANYIIGCLPGYKRFFLWFGGITGDRKLGMEQLRITASRGRYLMPFAKILLALIAIRENQPELARSLLRQLTDEFPDQPLFARELALLTPADSLSAPAIH